MVEKPMATSTAECRQMIEGCRAAGVALSVIKPWRYRGSTRGLYESLQRGDIGDVRMISLWWLYPRIPFIGKEWFRDPKEGGLFLDAGSHCFDYMRWIAGAEPVRLYAQTATYNADSETPRSTMTTVTFANGVMSNLWLSYEVPKPGWEHTDFRARVVGATGNLDAHGYGLLQLANGRSLGNAVRAGADGLPQSTDGARAPRGVLRHDPGLHRRAARRPRTAGHAVRTALPPSRWSRPAIDRAPQVRPST